jgi:hypothetical protein
MEVAWDLAAEWGVATVGVAVANLIQTPPYVELHMETPKVVFLLVLVY